MNRFLWIPATCCALVFFGLYATYNRAGGVERHSKASVARHAPVIARSDVANSRQLEAERALSELRDEFLHRRKAWELSSHRLLSRAAPRPAPTITIEYELASSTTAHADRYLLASLILSGQEHNERVPCVIDAVTQDIQIFDGKKWLTQQEWLNTMAEVADPVNRTRRDGFSG